jgi:hypothetical protein
VVIVIKVEMCKFKISIFVGDSEKKVSLAFMGLYGYPHLSNGDLSGYFV